MGRVAKRQDPRPDQELLRLPGPCWVYYMDNMCLAILERCLMSQGSVSWKHAMASRSWEPVRTSENGHYMFGSQTGIVPQSGWECYLFRRSHCFTSVVPSHLPVSTPGHGEAFAPGPIQALPKGKESQVPPQAVACTMAIYCNGNSQWF